MRIEDCSPRAQDYYKRVKTFLEEHVGPFEDELKEYYKDPKLQWTIHPKLETLKARLGLILFKI